MFCRPSRFIDLSLIMRRALQDAPLCSKGATHLRLVLEAIRPLDSKIYSVDLVKD